MLLSHKNIIKLMALSSVYLVWGAIASLNDLLIPYLKDQFELNFTQAMRIQLVFYAAYFFLSLPCGYISRRYGYRNGILIGIFWAMGGCLLMLVASQSSSYNFILGSIFVLASGITMLQVSANPYVMTLGEERTAPSRLTLVQSFHSLGTTIGPYFGAILIFSAATVFSSDALATAIPGEDIWKPYLILMILLACIALVFAKLEPESVKRKQGAQTKLLQLVRSNPRLLTGTLGIFFYVGAEISIASFLVNYLVKPEIAALSYEAAGKFVAVYWGLALFGRFVGAALLRTYEPARMLGLYAVCAAGLVLISISSSGLLAMWSILLVGFFNSIMFPTIFALSIKDLKQDAPSASGVLCLGIVGGAIISQAQGMLADRVGIQLAFLLPMLCYVYIATFSIQTLKNRIL
jgi:FHS family L-fucose permease-like MFS transporter